MLKTGKFISLLSVSVKAFHLKWNELPLDNNVKKWNVTVVNLDRNRRHLDRASLQVVWEVLDKYVIFLLYLPLILYNRLFLI